MGGLLYTQNMAHNNKATTMCIIVNGDLQDLEMAAQVLLPDYLSDTELTAFIVLDTEDSST